MPKSAQLDFAVELGIVIGQPATQVEDKDALGYVVVGNGMRGRGRYLWPGWTLVGFKR